jgi:hypothetical protein
MSPSQSRRMIFQAVTKEPPPIPYTIKEWENLTNTVTLCKDDICLFFYVQPINLLSVYPTVYYLIEFIQLFEL